MKRILAVLFVFALVPMAQAFGFDYSNEPAPQPSFSYSPYTGDDEMLNAVKRASASANRASASADRASASAEAVKSEVNALRISQENTKTAVIILSEAVGKTNGKIGAVESAVVQESNALSEQAKNNAWLNAGLSALAFIGLFLLGWWAFRCIRRGTTGAAQLVSENVTRAVNARADEIVEAVTAGFTAVQTGINNLPAEVKAAIETLDESPLVFDSAGHRVTYQSPVDGIREGYYLVLHVPEGSTGDVANFVRLHESRRGTAIRDCRGTMNKYFNPAYKADPANKMQIDLIDRLIATKELSYVTTV